MRSAPLVLALILAAAAILAIGSMRGDSATADEPQHIAAGLLKLGQGRLDFSRDQLPLMESISVAPLLLQGHRLPPLASLRGDSWSMGKVFLFRSGGDPRALLAAARLPTLAMFLALIVVVYAFVAAESDSRAWGLCAAALVAFCPNLLAHGRLVTTDLPVAFFCFAAAAAFLRLLRRPTFALAALAGILTAAALLTKASAAVLLVYFPILIVLHRGADWRRIAVMAASGAAFALVFVAAEMRRASVAAPFAAFLDWYTQIDRLYTQGHGVPQYLLGQFSYTGWRYYYLVAFLLKTTIPALLLVAGALIVAIRGIPRERRFAIVSCALFVLLFAVATAMSRLALGIRHVLPIYPFLYAGAVLLLAALPRPRALVAAVAALVVWHAGEAMAAYPRYIGYFNEVIGRRSPDEFLIDSNFDWGQDLWRLDAWCRANGVQRIAVHYFGGGDPMSELHAQVVMGGRGQPLPRGFFALSRHYYRMSFCRALSPIDYDHILAARHARRVATVGQSIDIYFVP